MGSGGLISLVSYGVQDLYLTASPIYTPETYDCKFCDQSFYFYLTDDSCEECYHQFKIDQSLRKNFLHPELIPIARQIRLKLLTKSTPDLAKKLPADKMIYHQIMSYLII